MKIKEIKPKKVQFKPIKIVIETEAEMQELRAILNATSFVMEHTSDILDFLEYTMEEKNTPRAKRAPDLPGEYTDEER